MAETERTLGDHGARITAAEGDIESMQEDITKIRNDIAAIRELLAEGRGGWRAIVFIGGVSATLGGLLVKYLPILK